MRFNNPVTSVFDELGRSIPNAELYFFENNTTTPKNTYSDKDLTNQNPHPVIADGAGRFPDMWLEAGTYRVRLDDPVDGVVWDKSDVNTDSDILLSSTPIVFETIVEMKALTPVGGGGVVQVEAGQMLVTEGYTTAGAGGSATYIVVAGGTGTPDDIFFLNLVNGLQAQRIDHEENEFDLIADMEAALWLGLSDLAVVLDSSSLRDNGGGTYRVVTGGTGTDDNINFVDLDNGNQAEILSSYNLLARVAEKKSIQASASGAVSINSRFTYHELTITGNITSMTFTGTNPGADLAQKVTIKFIQDNVGGWTVSLPTAVWDGGTAPTITSTADSTGFLTFVIDGSDTYGFSGGLDFS